MLRLILVGFLSLLSQVSLLRELNVAAYGIELVYPLAIAIWLFWTAAGALLSRRILSPSLGRFSWLLLALAALLPLDIAFLRGARVLFGGVPGAYLPLLEQGAILAASLLPPGFLSGLLFQWAAKLSLEGERTLAWAYSVESAGSIAGGLASTLLPAAGLQNFNASVLAGLSATAFALAAGRGKVLRGASAALSIALIALLVSSGALDRRMTGWNHPNLVAALDTPYGRTAITALEGQVSVFQNDALAFETQGTGTEEFAHLALLQHPHPMHVLVLGGGISGLLREVLKHGPTRVEAVELDRGLVELALPRLPEEIRRSMAAPGVRTVFSDPRRFLGEADPCDMILVGMPDPSSGQANRFYTREFFELARAKLEPGGILAFRLTSAENFLTPPMARRLASIHRAVRSVFGDALVLPGTTCIVLASDGQLVRDPAVLAERFRERKIAAQLVCPPYLEYVLTNDRVAEVATILAQEDVAANTDSTPICFQYTVMIWLSKFLPAAALLDLPAALRDSAALRWAPAIGLPLLIALFWMVPGGLRRALLAGIAGFAGMILETVWILYYQVKTGVLFQDLGLLLTLFMAGLAAGAYAMTRIDGKIRRRGILGDPGLFLLAGSSVISALTGLAVASGLFSSLPAAAAGLGLAGFFTAGIFARASLRFAGDQRSLVSPLYAADLLGGCLAAALGTFILIPVFGLPMTAGAPAVISLLALALL